VDVGFGIAQMTLPTYFQSVIVNFYSNNNDFYDYSTGIGTTVKYQLVEN